MIDGPQPTSGDGWRLLAVERTGDSYRTGAATTEDQYAALWAQSGVTAARPPVDFDNDIVIWFGAVYGSGCEIRMETVCLGSIPPSTNTPRHASQNLTTPNCRSALPLLGRGRRRHRHVITRCAAWAVRRRTLNGSARVTERRLSSALQRKW